MNRKTLISMIITIVLFIASVALIAFGVNMVINPVSYHYSHGFFSYYVSYTSSHAMHTGNILFSLGRALLISAFVMLGFTIYFAGRKKVENCADNKDRGAEKREKMDNVIDATFTEETTDKKEEQ